MCSLIDGLPEAAGRWEHVVEDGKHPQVPPPPP